MSRTNVFETIVGLVVIVVAALFLSYAYSISGRQIAGNQYRLDAVFGRVDGISVGSEVRIAGVKVGSVSAHALDRQTYEANLSMIIDKDVPIPEDSVAKIVSDGILGSAHVAIEPGAAEEMLIAGDKITITQGSVDLLGLAVQTFTAQSGRGGAKNDKPADDPLGDL
ncbi:MAG: outer membrane lipid asymmetry maintenance protein MlaD [Hyphococcus sp.]|nr:MAG: outer membrane lipid asymmetry maintenance protein MlaD [Marinicaulis sp.]